MVVGRGISATMVVLCMLGVLSEMAHATTYVVGGHIGGWAFNITDWPNGKKFKGGDILAPPGSKMYQSGHDSITLDSGITYFICTSYGHCEAKMKMAVNAA
ncbi:hypothetical protein VNO80_28376 [Phaseolus coccineus]|uniref:Phytocyanin domain-containing protein n=1 Tax=Phaseolus coccineus TaxID=3886 RepID=A0AAN9QDY3_PHACN